MSIKLHRTLPGALCLCLLGCFTYPLLASAGNNLSQKQVRGLVHANEEAVLSSQIAGRIIGMSFEEGDAFNKGDVLVELDCAHYLAELEAARAEHEMQIMQYENAKHLLSLNATSHLEADLMKARMRQAKASRKIHQIRIQHCHIRAPYNGRVVDKQANVYESVSVHQPLIAITGSDQLEVELIVPSQWLGWLQAGLAFRFTVDETGQEYSARVSRIGASVDPVSKTIGITGNFDTPPVNVIPGMSGSAYF